MKCSYCSSNPFETSALKMAELKCAPACWSQLYNSWVLMKTFWTPSPTDIFGLANCQTMLTTVGTSLLRSRSKTSSSPIPSAFAHSCHIGIKLLKLSSVSSSTTQYCCKFLSLQLWLCTLFAGHLEQLTVHYKIFLKKLSGRVIVSSFQIAVSYNSLVCMKAMNVVLH